MSKHPTFGTGSRTWCALLVMLLLNSLTFANCVLPPPNQLVRETLYNVPTQTGSWGVVLLENVPPGYTVTDNTFYLSWCVNAVASIVPGPPGYDASLYDTSDPADLAALGALGIPVGSNVWNKINYILNNKGTANATTLQAAIWRFTNPPAAPQEPSMIAGTYLSAPPESFPPADLNQINALEAAANANPNFAPGPGQVTAVYLYVPGTQPLVIEVVCPVLASIGDTVFCDFNRDGLQQPSEPGLAGVKVTLTGNNIPPQTAFTNASGNYLFNDLPAGNYTVTVDQTTAPPGCNIEIPNCPLTRQVPLADGQTFLDADFCFGTNGTIGDTVFCDFNRNGQQDPGDPGLQNVKVTLTGTTTTGVSVSATAFTDPFGKYLFVGLAPGNYTVTVDQTTAPAGCNVIIPNCPLTKSITLALGDTNLTADFCFGTDGTIGDTVFCDLNRNGVQDPGDFGLQGVKVTLTGNNINPTTTFTNASGKYLFAGLPPGTYTVTVDQTTAPPGCNVIIPNCPLTKTLNLALGQNNLDADFCFGQSECVDGVIGGIDLSGIVNNYLFFFANGSQDANWQGATKGFAGNVLVDGILASERTSGGVPYAGTIVTNDSTLGAWQNIVNQNSGQAFASTGNTGLVSAEKAQLIAAFAQINALTATPTYTSRSSTSLNGLNTQNGVAQTFVINVTSGFGISSKINITGDASDVFILRWDTDANFANGYQGIVKFQSGGAIVPLGGLKASNFIHVAGDINASGGGSNPPAPYPQGPRLNDGTGALITGGSNFNGGGFFTGYWLTTGDPVTGNTQPLSNGIFVGGWYTLTNKFSMTSGTSGVYVAPNCASTISGCVYVDLNGNGIRDSGLASASQWGIFVINGGNLSMNSSHITGNVALGPNATGSTLQKTDISGKFVYDPTSTWDQTNLTKDFLVYGGTVAQNLTQAQNDANTASSTFAAMTPTQTFGNLTGSQTITGNGGLNVIKINSLSYNSKTLTLKGGANDIFIINVTGGWTFADSKITLSGITAGQVVFNFPTTGPTIQMYKSTNVINGTFLAPYRSVIYHNPASFNGQIIAKNLTIHSDAKLTSVPLTVSEPCLAGVTVQLSNGTTTTTQVTTSSGYLFLNLAPGTYRITETALPSGYSFFKANPGSLGGTPATVAPATPPAQNSIQNIVVPFQTTGVNYDFGVKKN